MSKIRKYARGQDCQVRIPGVCNHNPETTVLAHLNGGGTGMKHSDIHGAFCCSECHDAVDGRKPTIHDADILNMWFLEGVIRTQSILLDRGFISVK